MSGRRVSVDAAMYRRVLAEAITSLEALDGACAASPYANPADVELLAGPLQMDSRPQPQAGLARPRQVPRQGKRRIMITLTEYRDETVRLLEAAIGLLERNGWTTGPGEHGGPRCAGMAVYESFCASDGLPKEAREQALDALAEAVRHGWRAGHGWASIALWNDYACRSLEQATGLLREAIKLIA